MAYQEDAVSGLTRQDMTIIGRKLAACLERKPGKIPVVHKPLINLNLPNLSFSSDSKLWYVSVRANPQNHWLPVPISSVASPI